MDIFDVLRKFFGVHHSHQDGNHRNNFRNPIWQNDEDDDEDYEDFRNQQKIENGDRDFDDAIINNRIDAWHTDPFQDFFNSISQTSDIMESFFNMFSNGTFDVFDQADFFSDQTQSPMIGPLPNSQLPQIEGPKQHLRDFFLKKETAEPRRDIQPQEDISLDGKVTAENLSELWKNSESSSIDGESLVRQPKVYTCVRSYKSQVITTPNGKEVRSTVTDCDGNVTTTIKKHTGDQIHTITIVKDKNGVETRSEDFIGTDQNQPLIPKDKINPDVEFPSEPLNKFPWSKYFGPKL